MTTEENNRREFEEWAKLKEYSTTQFIDSDEYFYEVTTTAWEAWQAARAKQSEIICRSCGLREERGGKPSFDF